MHGSGSHVNDLTVLVGAQRCAGFFRPGEYCPDASLFMPWPERGLEVRRLLQLLDFLGIPAQGEDLEFPLTDRDRHALAALPETEVLRPGMFVCIHAGASVPERRWPAARFAEVADALADQGFRVVLTGTERERELASAVAAASKAPCVNLAGHTDLGMLAALLEKSRLLICNDTGVSHLAEALRVPSVVISTGNNPERWAPANAARHRVLCSTSKIGADQVIVEAEDLLDEEWEPPGSSLESFPPLSFGERGRG